MRLFQKKYIWVTATIVLAIGYVVSCTKKDQVVINGATANTTMLVSYKTTTSPVIDGSVDAVWNNATALSVAPTVPTPGNSLFYGFNGEVYPATIKSLYDDTCIYFLVQWQDSTDINPVQPWYYDTTAKAWAQRSNSRIFDANGNLTKLSMGLDQLAFQWNIDNSTQNFVSQTCYASCHIFTPYKNFSGQYIANASGNHYTNGPNEKVDLWWAKLNKDNLTGQMDDWYIDYDGGPANSDTLGGSANGRHANGQVPSAPGSLTYVLNSTHLAPPSNYNGPISNSQTLKYTLLSTGKSVSVKVPLYIQIGTTKNYYTIDDVNSSNVKTVKAVDSVGDLTCTDGTVFNPNTDASGLSNYLDDPTIGRNVGKYCFPSFISQPYFNERANFTMNAIYDGTGWTVEFKRRLKTADVLKQDVDFTDLTDRPFGVAIWNTANNQHGIQPNLLLHFQK